MLRCQASSSTGARLCDPWTLGSEFQGEIVPIHSPPDPLKNLLLGFKNHHCLEYRFSPVVISLVETDA